MLSIVIPVHNEEKTIPKLHLRLAKVLNMINEDFEVIFVNDGSSDASLEIIMGIHENDKRVKAVSFSRNFGHQVAISAGLIYANGDAVIIMDGDLQDPPELIPNFINKWKEGNEVVYAVRKKRKEFIFKRFAYYLFYRLLKFLSNIHIPLDSGDFCLMDRKVVSLINSLPEKGRFIRGLRSWVGFRQVGIEFERDRRFGGKPKYTLLKLLKLAFDGIFSFSDMPLRLVMLTGFIMSGLSFIFAMYVILNFIFDIQMYFINKNPGWASLIVSITFIGGIQLISIGILGEYLGRVFGEVKNRPIFIVDKLIGIKK